MKFRLLGLACLGLAVLLPGGLSAQMGFRPLYNGRNLAGWHAKDGKLDVWKADGEILSCAGPGGGWLTTNREYGDFELRLEYRLQPGGNSGVGLRYPAEGQPWDEGMEIQLLDDDAPIHRDLKPAQYTGSIYGFSPPKQRAARPPGEWNHLFIRCRGPEVVIRLNGVEIQNANLDRFTESVDGKKPLAQRPRKGHLGFQDYGNPIQFRRIHLREL